MVVFNLQFGQQNSAKFGCYFKKLYLEFVETLKSWCKRKILNVNSKRRGPFLQKKHSLGIIKQHKIQLSLIPII